MEIEKTSTLRAALSRTNQKLFDEDLEKIKGLKRAKKTALAIFNIIQQHPKISVSEIVNLTHISKQAVSKCVKKLVALEILCPMKKQPRYQIYCYPRVLGTAKELYSNDLSNQNRSGCSISFVGKEAAIAQALIPSKIRFNEDIRHNKKIYNKNSQNSLFVCDNIDLLKHLIKTKTKPYQLIFCDSPYNQKTARRKREYTDTFDEHSGYLKFMYPRLMLCKELLDQNGLIVIAINEPEYATTKIMCNEIFSESNFLNSIVVESGINAGIYSSHSDKFLADTKFYLLVFAKNRKNISLNRLYDLADKKFATEYNTIIHNDLKHEPLLEYLKRQKWVIDEFSAHELKLTLNNIDKLMYASQKFENYIYETVAPLLYKPTIPFKAETYAKKAKNYSYNDVFLIDDKPMLKTTNDHLVEFKPYINRLQENNGKKQNTILRGTIWKNYQMFKNSVQKEGDVQFEGKKNLRLLQDIIYWINNKNARILDIFAGSGSTGHAVFAQNLKDGGNRTFCLCQIEESIQNTNDKSRKNTIDRQKTIPRLNNAIKETKTTAGYKIFRGIKT